MAVVLEAWYPQPSTSAVFGQAFVAWSVMADVLSGAEESTFLVAGQMWSKYILYVGVPLGPFRVFQQAAAASPDDEGRSEALRHLEPHLRFAVVDTETGQQVDQKDFVNKSFAP
jgi:hypothetical protein